MAGHCVYTPVSGLNTILEPAHLWSQGPLANGVRSWKLIIKHDMTHGFWCLPQCPGSTSAHFWSQSPLVNGVRSWQLIIKHYLTHRFHGRTLGVHPSVRVPHHVGTGPLLEPGSTCEWCQKVAFEYKT